MINMIIKTTSPVWYPYCYYRYPIGYLWDSGVTMMILVGMMSIAGVLAFSGGIGGFDILGSTDEEEALDQATPPTDTGEDKGPEPDADTLISGGSHVDHM